MSASQSRANKSVGEPDPLMYQHSTRLRRSFYPINENIRSRSCLGKTSLKNRPQLGRQLNIALILHPRSLPEFDFTSSRQGTGRVIPGVCRKSASSEHDLQAVCCGGDVQQNSPGTNLPVSIATREHFEAIAPKHRVLDLGISCLANSNKRLLQSPPFHRTLFIHLGQGRKRLPTWAEVAATLVSL